MDQTPYHFKFFKGCLPQNLLGPFLNTLTQIIPSYKKQLIYLINWLVSIWEEFGLLISLSYTHLLSLHCVKNVRIWSFPGPHFPAFGLNTERYEVSLRIQSECEKIRTRKTPNTDPFYTVLNITYIFEELLLAAFVILSLTCETQSQIKNTG